MPPMCTTCAHMQLLPAISLAISWCIFLQKVNVIRLGHPARLLPEAQRHVLDAVVRNSDASDVTRSVLSYCAIRPSTPTLVDVMSRGIAEDITTAIKRLQKRTTDKSTKYQLRSELTQLRTWGRAPIACSKFALFKHIV